MTIHICQKKNIELLQLLIENVKYFKFLGILFDINDCHHTSINT